MKLDFREIERQLVEWFPSATEAYISIANLTGDNIACFAPESEDGEDTENVNLTELAKHLTDFINQRGDKP